MENGINVTDKYVCFWGSIFSNWADTAFSNKDGLWHNSEQYFMWLKAKFFKDEETAKSIMNTSSPEEAKSLGRKVKGFNAEEWDKVCYEKMHKAVYDKFNLNKRYANCLLSEEYEGKHFVEGSPFDKIWGVGLIWNCPEIAEEKNWQGKNLLGKVLDQVRNELTV